MIGNYLDTLKMRYEVQPIEQQQYMVDAFVYEEFKKYEALVKSTNN